MVRSNIAITAPMTMPTMAPVPSFEADPPFPLSEPINEPPEVGVMFTNTVVIDPPDNVETEAELGGVGVDALPVFEVGLFVLAPVVVGKEDERGL